MADRRKVAISVLKKQERLQALLDRPTPLGYSQQIARDRRDENSRIFLAELLQLFRRAGQQPGHRGQQGGSAGHREQALDEAAEREVYRFFVFVHGRVFLTWGQK